MNQVVQDIKTLVEQYQNIISDLFQLFIHYNRLLSNIIARIPNEALSHRWIVNWQGRSLITLEELAKHYCLHLQIHLDHLKEQIGELQ